MKLNWSDPKHVVVLGGGLVSALLILPNLGKGLQSVAYVTQAVPVAYAARDTAEEVDAEFQQYLIEQRAYTKALQGYTQQLQRQQQGVPMGPVTEWDAQGHCWTCATTPEQCWATETWTPCIP